MTLLRKSLLFTLAVIFTAMAFFIGLVVCVIVLAGAAEAFPENIRHGYDSCTSCHVSPVGGGALTPYGRGVSEALSTWARDGEGQPLWGLVGEPPDWLEVGGDQRAVEVASSSTGASKVLYQYIPMQYDAELAAKIMPGITVDASVGEYGLDHELEYRRAYVKADVSPTVSLRVGRFMPAFGINVADHTTFTRQDLGLGEDDETYNAELAWIAPRGESILTAVYGSTATVTADPVNGFNTVQGNELSGAAWRGALYLGSSAQVGLSYLGVSNFDAYRQVYGAFAQVGLSPKAYVLWEADKKFEDGTTRWVCLAKGGYEVYQGLIATLQGDVDNVTRDQRVGLQWFPRPHWELLFEERRTYSDMSYRHFVDSGVLMLHHYL